MPDMAHQAVGACENRDISSSFIDSHREMIKYRHWPTIYFLNGISERYFLRPIRVCGLLDKMRHSLRILATFCSSRRHINNSPSMTKANNDECFVKHSFIQALCLAIAR